MRISVPKILAFFSEKNPQIFFQTEHTIYKPSKFDVNKINSYHRFSQFVQMNTTCDKLCMILHDSRRLKISAYKKYNGIEKAQQYISFLHQNVLFFRLKTFNTSTSRDSCCPNLQSLKRRQDDTRRTR